VARTQFGQIMDRAVEKNERFVVERRGKLAGVRAGEGNAEAG
jgi:hypothetical protein